MKVFSKRTIVDKELEQQRQSEIENQSEKKFLLSISSTNKNTVIDNKVKEIKKDEIKMPLKKKVKEVVETIAISENNGPISFKRNLRPRRSSTMLDDYIMTDSEEDEKSEPIAVEAKKNKISKLSKITTTEDLNLLKSKLSTEESSKKNLKINKTDLKPKKDLNKKDSEVKKNLSETKSKSNLLKCDKEPEIKNNKNIAASKKTEKLSKNKTETLVITKEPTKTTGEGSKNGGKKVPLSNKQLQLAKKETASNKKKLDLYNNNGSKKKSTLLSVAPSSLPSMFSGDTSQTKEELLEHMAANFDAKLVAQKDTEKSAVSSVAATSEHKIDVEEKKQQNIVVAATDPIIVEKKVAALDNTDSNIDESTNNKKSVVQEDSKQELKKISKIENTIVVAKEEHMQIAEKVENVVAVLTVDKLENSESLQVVIPFSKVEKVENAVFQTVAKDLFLHGQQKEIKITVPEFFSSKNFELPNRFKQDDGLSVLSEICSTLPRFNEPFEQCNRPTESSFVKYSQPLPLPPLPEEIEEETSVDVSLTTVQPVLPPPLLPSFESRTVKIVNLARGNSGSPATTNDKKDLNTSWKQAFKNVKLPKNGLTSAASLGNNLMQAWTKKKQLTNNVLTTPKIAVADQLSPQIVNGNCSTVEKKPESFASNLCQKTDEFKTDVLDTKKGGQNSSYLAKTTILNSTKYDLKFEKRSPIPTNVGCEKLPNSQQRRDADVLSSDDLQSPEKKIFGHQRRLSTTHSCNGNSSDAFSPDNETSVYAFQPDLPVASTPFRRNKPQSPAKSRTVSPNTSISVSTIIIYFLNKYVL